jgi:hypothetical protein
LQVSPAVKNYARVKDIIQAQLSLLKEYRQAYQRFSSSGSFSTDELTYMQDVYSKLIAKSLGDLDVLTTVLTAKKLRASDDERLKAIDGIYEDMTDKLSFLRHFNSNTSVLAAQRENEKNEAQTMQEIFGIEP